MVKYYTQEILTLLKKKKKQTDRQKQALLAYGNV